MIKKTDEQLGRLLTHEIVSMIQDKNLKDADVGLLIRAIIGFKTIKQGYLASFANSLKSGFIEENRKYIDGINKRRERNRNAEAKRRELANSAREDTQKNTHVRTCPMKGKEKKIKEYPPTPKGVGRVPSDVSAEEIKSGRGGRKGGSARNGREQDGRCVWCDGEGFCQDRDSNSQGAHCCNCCGKVLAEDWAEKFAAEIVEWYPYKVNPVGLKKTLLAEAKKTSARAVADGIAAWRESGAWDEERFIPRKIMAWIRGGCYGEKPPQKKSPAARADGGRALAAPSADATMRMIESEGEEE